MTHTNFPLLSNTMSFVESIEMVEVDCSSGISGVEHY